MTNSLSSGRSPRLYAWGPIAYAGFLAALWSFLIVVGRDRVELGPGDLVGIAVLTTMALVSAVVRDHRSKGAASSFTIVILLTCIVLYGPLVAGLLGLLVALSDRSYGVSIVPLFNGLMMGTMCAAGGLAYGLLGGSHALPVVSTSAELLARLGVPLLGADLAMCVVNVLVLAGMMAITGGSPRALLVGSVKELVPLYIGYALIAFVFVLLWGPAGVGPLSALLIAAPLAIAHFVYVQYGDEVRAHERIISMFTRSGDGPDGRVARHAERVQELCQVIAAQLGISEHDRQVLGYAAQLHDIAMKAVVRATDTQRGGSGPYTNVRALIPHPALAAELVSGVNFLADAAATIRSHHERMDGRGYPDGLVGQAIPLTARILAVADAFDALTTTRGERTALDTPGALAELQLSAGSHLDPQVLVALGNALRGRTWPTHVDPLNEGSWLWDHHTLPAMSDVIADEMAAIRAAETLPASVGEGEGELADSAPRPRWHPAASDGEDRPERGPHPGGGRRRSARPRTGDLR